jgi:hypothetical protein
MPKKESKKGHKLRHGGGMIIINEFMWMNK